MNKYAWKGLLTLALIVMLIEPSFAADGGGELSSSGIMNDALKRFHEAATTWGPVLTQAATRLFWSLVVIGMVLQFGFMWLRRADIGEFFAEFTRFIIVTGLFWWLLSNAVSGLNIAGSIVDSLQQVGAQAGGLQSTKLGPSEILDMGFDLYNRTIATTTQMSWQDMGTAIVMELQAMAVLLIMALIAANVLVVLATSWILLYGGVILLGFGGHERTRDIAINYFRTVLGVGVQLFSMILIIAIGKKFMTANFSHLGAEIASQELAVMIVIALILLFVVNKVPAVLGGIVSGAGAGGLAGSGIGAFGAGTAVGAAATAASVIPAVGQVVAAEMKSLAATLGIGQGGGTSSVMEAAKASQAADGGGMPMSSAGDSGSPAGNSDSGGGGYRRSSYAQAAGFDTAGGSGSGNSRASSGGGSSRSDATASASDSHAGKRDAPPTSAKTEPAFEGGYLSGVGDNDGAEPPTDDEVLAFASRR